MVFIYDVSQASAGARVISLLVLGAALYGVGFLYLRLQKA
jgi:hypothetical protein